MEKNPSILIVEGKEGTLYEKFEHFKTDHKIEKSDFFEASSALRHQTPRFVIFNLDHQGEEAKKILKSFSGSLSETFWAVSAEKLSSDELMDFVRLGVTDYLEQPFQEKEIRNFLERMDHWKVKKMVEPSLESHEFLSVFSSKGGVGVSFVAVNLAIALARRKAGRVLLADFVLQHGNVTDLLDMDPTFTLVELTQNLERLDQKFLENSIPRHSSGLFVLGRPKQPEESESLSTQKIEPVLESLKQCFNYVVVDGGHEFNATTLPCLDRSDSIFTVTTPDLPSLCNAKLAFQTFQKLGYSKDKAKLILNRWHMKGEIDSEVIEKNLSASVFHKFAEEPELVLSSMNSGIPVAELDKHSKLARTFDELVQKLVPVLKKED